MDENMRISNDRGTFRVTTIKFSSRHLPTTFHRFGSHWFASSNDGDPEAVQSVCRLLS
jgi:hypothetical protein